MLEKEFVKKKQYEKTQIVFEQIKKLKKYLKDEEHPLFQIQLTLKEKEKYAIIHPRLYTEK